MATKLTLALSDVELALLKKKIENKLNNGKEIKNQGKVIVKDFGVYVLTKK